MTFAVYFAPDYATARERFREAVANLGWSHEALPTGEDGPSGEPLTIDVGVSSGGDPERVLVVSSGLHGVEGFFGSAVQLCACAQWATQQPPTTKVVLLHALNPYGFAYRRRFDSTNIDPNRNFLLPGQEFAGAPEGYADLDSFLNPKSPPSRLEPFMLKAMWLIARHGLPTLQRVISAGQYDYPQGLFFGGHAPNRTQELLTEHLPRLLSGARHVVHLDFHTGLGPHGGDKLLIDWPMTENQRDWFTRTFGPHSFSAHDNSTAGYDARGGFGTWCTAQDLADEYLYACAEFGTYKPVKMLAGLRAENRAHHWGEPESTSTKRAKSHLAELFCPRSESWRERVVARGVELLTQAEAGLLEET